MKRFIIISLLPFICSCSLLQTKEAPKKPEIKVEKEPPQRRAVLKKIETLMGQSRSSFSSNSSRTVTKYRASYNDGSKRIDLEFEKIDLLNSKNSIYSIRLEINTLSRGKEILYEEIEIKDKDKQSFLDKLDVFLSRRNL